MGATLIGLAGLGAVGATLATNKSNQSYGAEQSEESRKWSTNERLASQEYNTQERIAAQEYNTSERLATQEYNSIGNQVGQFRSAGLNPNVLNNAVGFQGATPQHSTGATSSPGSASLSGIGTSQVPNIPQLISSGADLVNALSKRQETQATVPLLNEQVQNWILKNAGQETLNDLMSLEKTLKESTLPNDIKKSFEELAKLGFEKVVAQQLGKKYESESELTKVEKKVQEQVEKLTGENAIVANYVRMNWHRQFNSMLKLQSAQANEANAGAALKSEQINTEKSIQNINRFTADIKEIERNFNQSTFDTRFRQELSKLSALEINNMLEGIKANDMAAYSAFQRILYGKTQDGDLKKVINALDNIDNVSWSFNNYLGK